MGENNIRSYVRNFEMFLIMYIIDINIFIG